MSGEEAREASTLWRVLTTPVGPRLIVGRWPRARREAAVIEAAGLPLPVSELIGRIVRRTRLWRRERVDVARELVAHFRDALEAGTTPEEAVRRFGDPARAARLIRRAKKRGRGLLWRAWVRAWQAAGVLVLALAVLYAVLAVRFYTSRPVIRHDYRAALNAGALAVPEQDRAWPLYREAFLSLEPLPEALRRLDRGWTQVAPGHEAWDEAGAYLARSASALAMVRDAAARPGLGRPIDTEPDAAVHAQTQALDGEPSTPPAAPVTGGKNPPVMGLVLDHLPTMRRLAMMLAGEARHAAAAGDGDLVAADIAAMVGMAGHVRETPVLVADLVSFAIVAVACDTLGDVLAQRPDVLSDEQLRDLAHALGVYAGGGRLRARLHSERVFLHDLAQRIYSDDGRGGGRLSYAGLERYLEDMGATDVSEGLSMLGIGRTPAGGAAGPLMSLVVADRKAFMAEADRLLNLLEAEAARPAWEWAGAPGLDEVSRLLDDPFWSMRYRLLAILTPALGRASVQAERTTAMRDGALVAVALELHRRRHGSYPETLGSLTPALLPDVPRDPFDGASLRYVVREGRPVVYSIGADKDDDGGVESAHPREITDIGRVGELVPKPGTGAMAPLDGDWILWEGGAGAS